jgi:hypothetical protein
MTHPVNLGTGFEFPVDTVRQEIAPLYLAEESRAGASFRACLVVGAVGSGLLAGCASLWLAVIASRVNPKNT